MRNHGVSVRLMTLAAAALLSASLAFTPPATAASGAYLWNTRGDYAPACGSPGCPTGPGYLVRNGTRFNMYCWVDDAWRYYNGNWTNRWFGGYVEGIGDVFSPANVVFDQYEVPHCN